MRCTRFGLGLAIGAVLAAVAPAAAQAQLVPVGENYTLTKSGLDRDAEQNIKAVATRFGGKVADFDEIFDNAEQETRALDEGHVPANAIAGFRWEAENENEADWRPQGITGTADAWPSGTDPATGNKVLITSWYRTPPRPSNARLTLVKTTRRNARVPYRHVLLVAPTPSGRVNLIESHAGGIAWYRNHLYVAQYSDDGRANDGLRVFNLDDIIRVPRDMDHEVLTYNYILPQSGMYTARDNPGLRFSTVSVDRSRLGQHALVTAEFKQDQLNGRIVRWPLDENNGLMGATVNASGAWRAATFVSLQGALMKNGRFALSSSYGANNDGHLFTGPANETLRHTLWPAGVEDLFYVPDNDRLYTLTEFEETRRVFAVDASAAGL